MTLYRFTDGDAPRLHDPILVLALEGWVDAGGVATAAARHVAGDGPVVATFDTDALLDYRSRRPLLDLVDGEPKGLVWPEIAVRHVSREGRDLLVLTGPEPDQRWRAFTDAVVDLAGRCAVRRSIVLGSLAMPVPHTRPTQIVVTASDPAFIEDDDERAEGYLRVPAAAVSAIDLAMRERGVPAVGFYARTPHYVAPIFMPGALALVVRLERHLGVALDVEPLVEAATRERLQLDRIVEERADIRRYLEQLEEAQPGERLPSGEELAAEFERFLRGEHEA